MDLSSSLSFYSMVTIILFSMEVEEKKVWMIMMFILSIFFVSNDGKGGK